MGQTRTQLALGLARHTKILLTSDVVAILSLQSSESGLVSCEDRLPSHPGGANLFSSVPVRTLGDEDAANWR